MSKTSDDQNQSWLSQFWGKIVKKYRKQLTLQNVLLKKLFFQFFDYYLVKMAKKILLVWHSWITGAKNISPIKD
jgi:hypothetical protein